VREAPTAVITDGCFRQVEFAGILRGTSREAAARALIDFLLSEAFQEEVPLSMFVFPALAAAALPPEFVAHAQLPAAPLTMDPAEIEANRERWIEEWAEVVLR
jgi:thiamine transport system substrate-binding protein